MSEALALSEPLDYVEARRALLAAPGRFDAARRRGLAGLTEGWLVDVFTSACHGRPDGLALAAVGGFGRGELAPGSDLDLVLLHGTGADPDALGGVAERIWYPVWNSGLRLDHSVRTAAEARRLAKEDLAVLLGLLDARAVAGDAAVVRELRGAVLADWRAAARKRLPELHASVAERAARSGDVRYALEPDLKEGRGGLRDVTVLRALTATWLADRPHAGLEEAAATLSDVRSALQLATGRPTDRLVAQEHDAVAQRLGIGSGDEVLGVVAEAASVVAYAADVTWRRVEQALRPRRRWGRAPERRPLGDDVVEQDGEAVLALAARPQDDAGLPLRVAAAAAQAGVTIAPATLERLARECPDLPEPWPAPARDAFVALLGAGRAAVPVWEALDQVGLVARWLPEWAGVRHRPQHNPLHRYTVDRHSLETAVEASAELRRVRRPDLLLLAALLHDLGKGVPDADLRRHAELGVPLAAAVVRRMGYAGSDVTAVEQAVRHHLLLPATATSRDPDDPATTALVQDTVRTAELLDLLQALTHADARAAGPAAASAWRMRLVDDLVTRVRALLHGGPEPARKPLGPGLLARAATGELSVEVRPDEPGWVVSVVAPDRVGLVAAVAGVLALHRFSVRTADIRTESGMAVDEWWVDTEFGEGAPRVDALREDLRRALDGSYDVHGRLARRDAAEPPRRGSGRAEPLVVAVPGASAKATVLEVRAHSVPGLLHRLAVALTTAGVDVRGARVATLGAEAVDVFYVVGPDGLPLAEPGPVVAALCAAAR